MHLLGWFYELKHQTLSTSDVDTDNCDDFGGYLLNDICYILGDDQATWKEAREYCQDQYDGDLAVVVKKVVYDFILDVMDDE